MTGSSSYYGPRCRNCEAEGFRLTGGLCDGCYEATGYPLPTPARYVWMRSWPSGSIHAVSKSSLTSPWQSPSTACGICWPGKRWSHDYPPGTRTCEECQNRYEVRRATEDDRG